MNHSSVRAKVIQDNTGAVLEFPIIVTEQGVLQPLVDYFLEKADARSYSWMQKVVQSVETVEKPQGYGVPGKAEFIFALQPIIIVAE